MTNLPFTGRFKVTYPYGVKNASYIAGFHTGIDLVGITNIKVYATCNGTIYKTGYDAKGYGKYVVIKADDGKYHWLCHLASISVKAGQRVTRANTVGVMGSTGNSTGKHTHYEIRTAENKYGVVENPADYMGIPNAVGTYDSANYQVSTQPAVEYYPACAANCNSLVEALNSIGVDSSYANRKAIAIKNGISGYKGTAAQNTSLLQTLKEGKLIK